MTRTYRDIAIEDMVRTVEEAMSRVIDYWGDLPAPMKEAIEQFRTQLGAAIDSVEFVKRALDRQYPKLSTGKALPDVFYGRRMDGLCGPRRMAGPAAKVHAAACWSAFTSFPRMKASISGFTISGWVWNRP